MNLVFWAAAAVALGATALAISRANPVHALLYFVVSLIAMAVIFFILGAPFAAALEVIVYAGAIVVLFLFVVMMLSLEAAATRRETSWITGRIWVVPIILVGLLGAELARVVFSPGPSVPLRVISPAEVGLRLCTFGLPAVELASMLLLAGLLGAFHLGRKP